MLEAYTDLDNSHQPRPQFIDSRLAVISAGFSALETTFNNPLRRIIQTAYQAGAATTADGGVCHRASPEELAAYTVSPALGYGDMATGIQQHLSSPLFRR